MKFWLTSSFSILFGFACIGHARAADIVDTAVGNGSFKTLVAAVQAADLVDTLKGKGPFTVLAPTDEAFAKLPEGTIPELLKPENKAKLAAILTYHVIPGSVEAKDALNLATAGTVNGQRVTCSLDGGQVMLNDAKLLIADIECDNGIIHVIDSVLLPSDKTIPQIATEAGSFETLLAAVGAAELAETLSGDGPFTVFAPTDDAFAALPEGTVADLVKPENKAKLIEILTYHVVAGRVYADQALAARNAKTLQGGSISVTASGSGAKVNSATLLKTDIEASNGVIHVIDQVLLPGQSQADCRQMIMNAISRGVPMYNSGHHSACADLYEETMVSVMKMTTDPHLRSRMHSAISKAQHQRLASRRAWTLRNCMDDMAVMLP